MNEWEFVADIASCINEIIANNPSLPFSRANCEQRDDDPDSSKRRDLTVYDKNRRIVLTGEVKLPYRKGGGTPYNDSVFLDARSKASKAETPFFFTWNVNHFVLWETRSAKASWTEHNCESWEVVSVHKESHLGQPVTMQAIRAWLALFLDDFAKILLGTSAIGSVLPDVKFVKALESALHIPILFAIEKLDELYRTPRIRESLDKWMRDQGWMICDDASGIRDNLERSAKFACYTLVNKLVFHEALWKRHGTKMSKIVVPDHIDTGEKLRLHLEGYFAEAKKITGDYETVFGEDSMSVGSRIPFYSDLAVPHWQELTEQIHTFDFSKIDYDVIGNIFERLISPEERRKYGQYYTRVEIVDLINSFCIRSGDEKIMDPACGGGTFLVRAYTRKKELAPDRKHKDLISELYGVDISSFATHLTTINLATRDLIDAGNYPRIERNDFFDIEARNVFVRLPKHGKTKRTGKHRFREIVIPPLDAVIGNPPYIRQEEIPKSDKKDYQSLIDRESRVRLSGRSDIHCYFWVHAASFIKNDGYLCFLTSSQWLDVEYGFRLQDWILRNFEIIAIFESIDEPWFVGARVATTVTILRRQSDEQKRMDNTVRFVQLRRPIREILSHDGTSAGAMVSADEFRDEISTLAENTSDPRYRARLIRQGDLWKQGVMLGNIMGKSEDSDNGDSDNQSGEYYGGKWGIYLRAPDMWFGFLDKYGDKFVPLGNIAELRYGIKTGKDDFFFVKDHTASALETYRNSAEFQDAYGAKRKDAESGKVKIVRCGEGYDRFRPMESEFLEPEIHSLMEIEGYTVTADDCSRHIFLVSRNVKELKGTHALKYIRWGESENFDKGISCANRVGKDREWYDLTGHKRSAALWPKERQYRHIAPSNPERLAANCRLYEIHPIDEQYDDPDLWGGILNSTWVLFSSLQFGRPVGNEGNWSTMVSDANMMLVPDPLGVGNEYLTLVKSAFGKMKQRKALAFLSERRLRQAAYRQAGKEDELSELSELSETDMPDRRELDDAILRMIGIGSENERKYLIDALYGYVREFFEQIRLKEEKAILCKKRAKRRNPNQPNEIAAEIYREIVEKHVSLLRQYDSDFLDTSKPFDTYELPDNGNTLAFCDLFRSQGVRFAKGRKTVAMVKTRHLAQADLIVLIANADVRGFVRIPCDEDECRKVSGEYREFVEFRSKRISELIEERTSDEVIREKISRSLGAILGSGKQTNKYDGVGTDGMDS